MTFPTTRSDQAFSLGKWLIVLHEDLTVRSAKHQKYRATVEELELLSDRDLVARGMHRVGIRDVAHEHVYGPSARVFGWSVALLPRPNQPPDRPSSS